MFDWTVWVTEEEHESINPDKLKRTLAASRKLVAAKDEALVEAREWIRKARDHIADCHDLHLERTDDRTLLNTLDAYFAKLEVEP